MKKNTDLIIISILILIITSISFYPLLYTFSHTPKDREYTGINRWSEDYYGYLGIIQIGKRGMNMQIDPHTSKPHVSSLVHEEYILMGKFSKILNWSSVFTYHFFRYLFSILFLLTAYFFIRSFLPKLQSIIAFLFAFTIGSLPTLPEISKLINGSLPIDKITYPLPWLIEFDIVRRTSLTIHYQLSYIFFLLSIIFFLKCLKKITVNNTIFLGLFTFLLAFLQPTSLFIFYGSLPIFSISKFLSSPIKIFFKKVFPAIFLPALIIVVASTPILFYFRYIFSLPFWNFVMAHGATTPYNIPIKDFLLAIGPTLLFAPIGIIMFIFVKNKISVNKNQYLILISWLFFQSLTFFWLYKVFNFDRIRAIHPSFYIPLAIFAIIFLDALAKFLQKLFRIPYHFFLIKFYLFFFILSLPSSLSSINFQIHEYTDYKTFSTFSFPTTKQVEAFNFLENNTKQEDRVLTLYEGTYLIPALAGNNVVLGINYNKELNFKNREEQRNKFLQGILSEEDAKKFIKNENISYIYWGFQERSLGGNITKYSFLKPVFQNDEVTIFKTNN